MSLIESERARARAAVVDEHIRCENSHDLDALMATFGINARYDDEPWGDHRIGRDGVRSYYSELMRALPDLAIEVKQRHVTSESVVVEVLIRGTHLDTWRGLPPTGRRMEFPLCGIYSFDADGKLASERIYYDRGTILRQLGLFHDPVRGRADCYRARSSGNHRACLPAAFASKCNRTLATKELPNPLA
jgi:steroid delta-isomerase-like uncharacterized protein